MGTLAAPMTALLDHLAIARLEERRVGQALEDLAPECRPMAGGVMARGTPALWYNACYGAGLNGRVTIEDVRGLVEFHASGGVQPRIKACTLADVSLFAALGEEGFVVRRFESVYARSLDALHPAERAPRDDGVEIRPVDRSNDDEIERYARLSVGIYFPRETEKVEALVDATRRMVRHPSVLTAFAFVDGACVGKAALELRGEVAAFIGAGTLEGVRRRGVQTALMRWRLDLARERGARWATVLASPGVATERNARRLGFELAYARSVMVRPGEGLTPVAE